LKAQRLDRPYVRKNGKLQPASWDEALSAVAKAVNGSKPNKIGAIAGSMSGVEELFAMKGLLASIGSTNMDCRAPGSVLDPSNGRESYLFNATIAGIEESDALLIVGANPRFEAAVMNSRILKRVKMGDYPVGVVGDAGDLRYPYEDMGAKPEVLKDLISGKNKFAAKLKKAKRPMIVVGQGALERSDSKAILGLVSQLAADTKAISKDWNGLSILHTNASTVGALDLGFVPGNGGKATTEMMSGMDVLFLMGADEIDMQGVNGFTVYMGTHGDAGAHRADVILPASAYTEKSATYVNTEGRVQMTSRAAFAPGDAKEDWAILRALSAKIGRTLPYDNLNQLRNALYEEYPHFATLDEVAESGLTDVNGFVKAMGASKTGKVLAAPLTSPVKDFFMTNPIARASKVMAECSAMRSGDLKQAAE